MQHKQNVLADVERVEREVETLRGEAEDAKKNLMRFREEIRSLEHEKGRMLAALASARARRRMHEALDGLSVEADVQALENVRMHVQRSVAAATLERELGAATRPAAHPRAAREAIEEGARRELDALKQELRPALPHDLRARRLPPPPTDASRAHRLLRPFTEEPMSARCWVEKAEGDRHADARVPRRATR